MPGTNHTMIKTVDLKKYILLKKLKLQHWTMLVLR